MRREIFYIVMTILLASCSGVRNNQIYIDTDFSSTDDSVCNESDKREDSPRFSFDTPSDEISIPFLISNGVKYVSVSINGVDMDMIFDTGCSMTSISLNEAQDLYDKGLLTNEDFLGDSYASVADGRVVPNKTVNLKEVVLGNKIKLYNVKASIQLNTDSPLLLGNTVLDQMSSYSIDNEAHLIHFTMKY